MASYELGSGGPIPDPLEEKLRPRVVLTRHNTDIAEMERENAELRAKLAEAHSALRKVIVACGGIAEPGVSHGFLLNAPGEVAGRLAELKVKVARAQDELDAEQEKRDEAEARLAAEAAKVAQMRAAINKLPMSSMRALFAPLIVTLQADAVDALHNALALPVSDEERKATEVKG